MTGDVQPSGQELAQGLVSRTDWQALGKRAARLAELPEAGPAGFMRRPIYNRRGAI
jgi:hypothetical protein